MEVVLICPVCGGPKTKRAHLCAGCRRAAIAAGVNLLLADMTPAAPRPPHVDPFRTPGQSRAYHGKCGSLAQLEQTTPQRIKQQALEHISAVVGRPVLSSKDLTEDEMSDLLDWLDESIASVQP
jgi:hypothetical protein